MSIVMPPGGWPPPRKELYGEAKWISTSIAMLFSRGDTDRETDGDVLWERVEEARAIVAGPLWEASDAVAATNGGG